MITAQHIRTWIHNCRTEIDGHADALNRLDAQIGDGDYGASMQRGLAASELALSDLSSNSLGELLQTTGGAMVAAIGGTSGPLVGSFFLRAGTAIGEVAECELVALASALRDGTNRVILLGGAAVGDKTMVDALVPAVDALEQAAADGVDDATAARRAAEAAIAAAEATRDVAARRGRASYTGTSGVGCVDPGARGVAILYGALASALAEPAIDLSTTNSNHLRRGQQ